MVRLSLFLMVCPPAQAAVTAYPSPPNAVKSSVFSVLIDGTAVPVVKHMNYHYAHFAFSGTVDVAVRSPKSVSSHRISPASLGIQGNASGNELKFSMTQAGDEDSTPRYLVVQIDDLEKLVLLGDPPQSNVPPPSGEGVFNVVSDFGADPTGATYTQPAIQAAIDAASAFGSPSKPGVVYVPPGHFRVRAGLKVKDNVDLYLAPGAILKADDDISNYRTPRSGTIAPVLMIDRAANVTIRGRGEVDASGVALMGLLSQKPPVFLTQSRTNPRRRAIQSSEQGATRNLRISGIIVKDATGWSLELVKVKGVVVQNVKILNHTDIHWKIQNDGINATSSSDVLVNQCFVMTIDDAMCSKARYKSVGSMDNVVFANNVLWTWAAGVKAGMQNDHPMNGVVFRNIDIVHCRRAIAVDTKTSKDRGEEIPIAGVKFQDIRVDEIQGHWKISKHDAVEFQLEDAPALDIEIRNLTLPMNRPLRCRNNYPAKGVRFSNLVMAGELITDVSQVTLAGNQAIENLTFATDGSGSDSADRRDPAE
nr:glycosyl hydrolase family 28-related protein [Aeoliella straminimaris]